MPSSCLLEEIKCKQVQQTPEEPCSDHMDGFISAVMWLERGEREQKDLEKGPFTPLSDKHWT